MPNEWYKELADTEAVAQLMMDVDRAVTQGDSE